MVVPQETIRRLHGDAVPATGSEAPYNSANFDQNFLSELSRGDALRVSWASLREFRQLDPYSQFVLLPWWNLADVM